jgi:hypothetical protein
MADDREPIDWYRVVIHGLFGLILGGLVGLGLWAELDFRDWGIVLLPVPAVVMGVAGALWGDDFWEGAMEWWRNHGHWFWWS